MNNQWKMVPVDLLKKCRVLAAMQNDRPTRHLIELDTVLNAPVPPADDVDVFSADQWWLPLLDAAVVNGSPDQKRAVAVVRNMLDHVTRLTAERDQLKRVEKALCNSLTIANEHCADLQSELTKARELLKSVRGYVNRCAIGGGRSDRIKLRAVDDFIAQQPATPIAHNADESCGQDAECNYCGGDGYHAAPQTPGTTCEACNGSGQDAEAANTVNGLTDDEWQDRDDQDRQELERD